MGESKKNTSSMRQQGTSMSEDVQQLTKDFLVSPPHFDFTIGNDDLDQVVAQ